MHVPKRIADAAWRRVEQAEPQIRHSLRMVADGNPLGAEPKTNRLIARLQTKAGMSREEAETVTLAIRSMAEPPGHEAMPPRPERIYGGTLDFVGVAFLERGMTAAKAVARVTYRDGRAQGSGFMVSDRLFLTNNHVVSSREEAAQFVVEFDYELDPTDSPRGPSRFSLDPSTFFITDDTDDLDYTLISVGVAVAGPKPLSAFGWCPLSDASDKHALGEVANIVQHPDGRYKEVVLRENRLVSRLETVLHYVADTEPGASGAPVFNNEWQAIALHHWGSPWRQRTDENGRAVATEVNEGIRISAIVRELKERVRELPPGQQALLRAALAIGTPAGRGLVAPSPGPEAFDWGSGRLRPDGSVSWRIPLELSVRLPGFSTPSAPVQEVSPVLPVLPVPLDKVTGEARARPSKDYSDRTGYKPRFIEGFMVDLPQLTTEQERDAARNRQAEPGDDPFELKYHHFSIVMNARRRLAFFTACNIDGTRSKLVDRDTGQVTDLEPDSDRLEAFRQSEGAEASDSWYDDGRLDRGAFAGRNIYERQEVPGFPNTRSRGRTERMFQRGHLVRRVDPAWGTEKQALAADADTFHFTNCAPQVGFFNMGTADRLNLPNTGGGALWRALENYVLRNAVVEQKRISVFTGPVFDESDRRFRSIQVPGRFWKIVVWADGDDLRSVAMIADQRPVITVWPEARGDLSEAFLDPAELGKVEDFLTTVAELERLTGLTFDKSVRQADIRDGQGEGERLLVAESLSSLPLRRKASRRSSRASKKAD